MNDGWIWRAFTREMIAGRVDQELVHALEAAGELPMLVTLVTAIQDLPSLEHGEDRTRGDPEHVWFRPTGDGLERIGEHNAGEVARRFEETESMASIAQKLADLPDVDWRWVEVMIGIPFRRVAGGGLAPTDIWRRACAPWTAWLR